MISRRQILLLSAKGLCLSPTIMAQSAEDVLPWQTICEQWLELFIPKDSLGPGANTPEVWTQINTLMADNSFANGFKAGLYASAQIEKPDTDEKLTALMSSGSDIAGFLNAFLDIVIEAYYGSPVGYRDIGIDNAPQPKGYPITIKNLDH